MERLRADLNRPLEPPNPNVMTTASIGLAYFAPEELPASAALLLVRADRSMYESKAAGRNRVTVSELLSHPSIRHRPDTSPISQPAPI